MSTVKTLKNISAYQAGESKIAGKNDVIKLSSNESPFGPVSYTHLTLPTNREV